jgi:hypothetical protein
MISEDGQQYITTLLDACEYFKTAPAAYSFENFRRFQEQLALKNPYFFPIDTQALLYIYQHTSPTDSHHNCPDKILAFIKGVKRLPKTSQESLSTFMQNMKPVLLQDLQLEATQKLVKWIESEYRSDAFSLMPLSSTRMPGYHFWQLSHTNLVKLQKIFPFHYDLLECVFCQLDELCRTPLTSDNLTSFLDPDDQAVAMNPLSILDFMIAYLNYSYGIHAVWYLIVLHQYLFLFNIIPKILQLLATCQDVLLIQRILIILTLISNQGESYSQWIGYYAPWIPLTKILELYMNSKTTKMPSYMKVLCTKLLQPLINQMPIYIQRSGNACQ